MLKLTSLVAVALAGILATASHAPAARPASVGIKDFTYGPVR